jgi:hypothetical protein
MRSTDPKAPLLERESENLLEELCLALRDMGVFDWSLTTSDRGLDAMRRVKELDD